MLRIEIWDNIKHQGGGTPRRKIVMRRGNKVIGSVMVSKHQDLTQKLNLLLIKLKAVIKVPQLGRLINDLPVELL